MKSKESVIFAKNKYMLLRCNIGEWAGFPQRARETLLNTRRMSRITARNGGSSRIYYSYPDGHRRGDLHPLLIDATVAEINAASETALFNDFCEFEVYPKDSLSESTYIMHIKVRDILRITAYDNDHCLLYVHHNEVDIQRYLVRYGIEAIYNILIGGSTTTGEDFSWSSYWRTRSVQFFDGTVQGGELVDKSPLGMNAKFSSNPIRNGDCEQDYGYYTHNAGVATSCEVARSATQSHDGTYSWKCTVVGGNTTGIKSSTFSVITGHSYTFGMWIYIESTTALIIRCGVYQNGSVLGTTLIDKTKIGEWQYITATITATQTTSNCFFFVWNTSNNMIIYIDQVSIIDNTEAHSYVELRKNSNISDHDALNLFYDTSADPKAVDITKITTCSNDKIFANITANKLVILTRQVTPKEKVQTLNWLGGTYTIDDYFTTARTIKGYVVDEHYAFNGFANIGGRLYCFLRKGLSHNVLGSTIYMTYSDDGITWTDIVEVYTGAHILVDHPEILVADPDAVIDVRDSRCLVLANGNLLVFTTIVAGHMDGDSRVEAARYAMCLQIPVTGKVADWESMAISYMPEVVGSPAFAGGCKEYGGAVYATTYEDQSAVYLHKSEDSGATWTKIGDIFGLANYQANENDIAFVGSDIYVFARQNVAGTEAKSVVAKSVDGGITWTDRAEVNTSVHYPHLTVMSDGKILVYGRNNYTGYGSRDITIHKMDGLAISGDITSFVETVTQDVGYGQMVYKDGTYYFSYHDGPASETYTGFADAGVYYKAIYGKIQEY